eukprot:Skav213405  [mRNA]  locus=scaffold797:680109:681562:- [translate_table: standard]
MVLAARRRKAAGNREAKWQDALWTLSYASVRRDNRNIISFNSTINICRKAAKWQLVLSSFQLQRSVFQADVVTYSITTSAAAAAVRWRHASVLLQDLRGVLLEVLMFSQCPNAPLCRSARKAFCQHFWKDICLK